jgi:hypothetical protein
MSADHGFYCIQSDVKHQRRDQQRPCQPAPATGQQYALVVTTRERAQILRSDEQASVYHAIAGIC